MPNDQDIWKTRWDLLRDLPDKAPGLQREILDRLMCQYWSPIFWCIRRRGYSEHEAEDLAQEFFCQLLNSEFFTRADRDKGPFRAYLLGALRRFLNKAHRHANAGRRKPPAELVSTGVPADDAVVDCDRFSSPEKAFHYMWTVDLLERALDDCRRYFQFSSDARKQRYWGAYYDRVLRPMFEGAVRPPLAKVAADHDLPKDKLSAILVTVKRRVRRSICGTVRQYVRTDADVEAELEELQRLLE